MPYRVGDTVVLDGIESVIIYDNGSEADWGRYIVVDKNHDLSYYIYGSDYVNEKDTENACINLEAQYGYEWGGYETDLGMTSSSYQEIGKGLSNTNTLISKNLQPNTSGWKVLWDMVEQFRSSHSDDWFVPSLQELNQVYSQRSYLENLSMYSSSTYPYYWTSSESNLNYAYRGVFGGGAPDYGSKYSHIQRSRLCRYTTGRELDLLKKIQITSTTDQASIYYTIDNSTPTSNSTLYNNTFQVETGTTIKAIGIKEGYIDSDIATLTV